VRQVEGNPELVRIYTKGAPEYIFQLCNRTHNNNMEAVEFTQKDSILADIIGAEMAGTHMLKVISYAYKEVELKVLNELMHQFPLESDEFREALESDLIYLATFGLLDPLRDNIVDGIQLIRYGRTV